MTAIGLGTRSPIGSVARVPRRIRSRRFRPPVVASALFIALVTGTIAFADRAIYGDWQGKASGDKLTVLFNLLMIAVAGWLFWRRWRLGGRLMGGEKLLLALAALVFMSAAWSVDPQTTIRRAVLYLAFIAGAIGVSAALDGDEIMVQVRNIAVGAAILSLLLFVLVPGYVGGFDGRDFRGIYAQKNVLGQVMAAGGLAALHGWRSGRQRGRNAVAILLLGTVVVMSKSGTSLMVFIGFCSLSAFVVLVRKGGVARLFAMFMMIILAPFAITIVVLPDIVLEVLGKDPTLTGRTDLWAMVMDYIYARPFLGWGFDAFWSPANPAANAISSAIGWIVPEAHNGILEMLLELGLVGTFFFVLIFVRNIVIATRSLRTPAGETGVTLLLCCVGLVAIGVTELVLVDQTEAPAIIFFLCGLSCERMVRAHRRSPLRRGLVR